jgi:transposase
MREGNTFVGLDAHKKTIQVCMLLPDQPPVEWQVANEGGAIRRMAKRIRREARGDIVSCYEAGPCGYSLQRQLNELKMKCQVVAPSLIPVKPGDRIKTDRRDARKLAGLLRAGLLTEVHPPTKEEESVRDLCRAREDVVEDLQRCRHRLVKLLLRRGVIWDGKAWTQTHRTWLRSLNFEREADTTVLADYLLAIEQAEARLRTLEDALEICAAREPYKRPVAWLRCFRGISTITALTIVAELHDFRRFESARELMAYLGLVPSEYSSSESRHQGSITKAGNCHVRRVLIETAWHYRHPFRIGPTLSKRREGQPAEIIAITDKAGQRLHRRFHKMTMRGKPPCKIAVAIARELAGFIWAVLHTEVTKRTA